MDLQQEIDRTVTQALEEDIGPGDLTAGLVPAAKTGKATVLSRELAVLCGIQWFEEVFRRLDPDIRITWSAKEGDVLEENQTFCEIVGPMMAVMQLRGLLTSGEQVNHFS